MSLVFHRVDDWVPAGEVEQKSVLFQLAAILKSPYFRTSRRYPSFLRFIVELALAGRGNELKERTIGVEVFGRELTYDTNADPIVRVTAGEVRKRLTQYYSEPAHQDELQIRLSSGSYVPHFEKASAPPFSQVEMPAIHVSPDFPIGLDVPEIQSADTIEIGIRAHLRKFWFFIAGIGLTAAMVSAAWTRMPWRAAAATSTDPLAIFWHPFLGQREPILACIGPVVSLQNPTSPSEPTPNMAFLEAVQRYNTVPLPDAITLSEISRYLGENHVTLRIKNSEGTSFDDVQAGPTILIGALNNVWTTRLTSKLRFSFQDSPDISRIIDHEAKTQPNWLIYRSEAYSNLVQDYAVIARYQDSTTGRVVIIAAGIGPNGTLAAGEFLTNRKYLQNLLQQAPKGWAHNNVEAVIATQVINGKSGPPRLVASQFW